MFPSAQVTLSGALAFSRIAARSCLSWNTVPGNTIHNSRFPGMTASQNLSKQLMQLLHPQCTSLGRNSSLRALSSRFPVYLAFPTIRAGDPRYVGFEIFRVAPFCLPCEGGMLPTSCEDGLQARPISSLKLCSQSLDACSTCTSMGSRTGMPAGL